MGLDMYLKARKYTSKYTDKELNKKLLKLSKIDTTNTESAELVIQVGYWRKANHIHKWFVDNVQEGADNCRNYDVSKEQLKDLLKLCKEIKEENSKAEELLPSQTGFFFGSYEYDEWYFDGINETIEIIERVLKIDEDWSFEYNSCW
tara:strand:+ start:460 stop:900 length:441 start_codon:yes stop_codon:yes gene_type:complete